MATRPRAPSKVAAFSEKGTTGLNQYGGFVYQEFQRDLVGTRGQRTFREMSDNDPVIGAILTGIDLLIRRAEWRVEPPDDTTEAKDEADFVKSLMGDMSTPWDDFIANANSMLAFGWSFAEIVLKLRDGKGSQFDDGRVGIKSLAPRAQDTLFEWQVDPGGSIQGWWQLPPAGGQKVLLTLDKGLLFRTSTRLDNPEGRSILRNAWRPWLLKKVAEEMEAIGIERELAGVPIVRAPATIVNLADSDPVKAAYISIARDLKRNEQGGILLPSDVWRDPENKPTSQYLYTVELLQGSGPRSVNTNEVITRYERAIARSVLADFLMLGTDGKGSYALSENKTSLFIRACETYAWQIAAPINRYLLPMVWEFNQLDPALMPQITPGSLAPVDLQAFGTLIKDLAGAGMPLFPDDGLEDHIREISGLPAKSAETIGAPDSEEGQEGLEEEPEDFEEEEPSPFSLAARRIKAKPDKDDDGSTRSSPGKPMPKFDESEHPRGPGGRFGDKPDAEENKPKGAKDKGQTSGSREKSPPTFFSDNVKVEPPQKIETASSGLASRHKDADDAMAEWQLEYYKQGRGKWGNAKEVSDNQIALVRSYTSEGFFDRVNRDLRDGNAGPKTKLFERAMNGAIYDMLKTAGSKNKLPAALYRGYDVDDLGAHLKTFQSHLNSGKPLVWNSFSSTSADPEVAMGFGKVTVVVRNPKTALDIRSVAEDAGEKEFLMPTGVQFKVVSAKAITGFDNSVHRLFVEIEEIKGLTKAKGRVEELERDDEAGVPKSNRGLGYRMAFAGPPIFLNG